MLYLNKETIILSILSPTIGIDIRSRARHAAVEALFDLLLRGSKCQQTEFKI